MRIFLVSEAEIIFQYSAVVTMKLAFTFFGCQGNTWNGLGLTYRCLIMTLVMAEVVYCFYIFNTRVDFPAYSQIILIFAGALSLYLSIRGTIRYVTPILLSLFYLLGYPLYLAGMMITPDQYTIGGWLAVGNFNFSKENLTELGITSGILMLGLFLGGRLVQSIVPKRQLAQKRVINVSKNRLRHWIIIWFVLSMALILFFASLGLGRTGLQDAIVLPFGVKGILLYVRDLFVPIMGAFLLQQAADTQDWKNLVRVLICSLIISTAMAVLFMSRGSTLMILLPFIGYMLMHQNAKLRRTALLSILPFVIGIVLATQVVAIIRNVAYSGDGFKQEDLGNVVEATGTMSFTDIAENILVLLTIRQGGARDMGVVMTSSYKDIRYIWTFYSEVAEMDFMTDVWGFAVDEIEQDGKSFGTGFNGLAWYYFGQSWIVLFILASATGAFLVWIEDAFLKRGWRCTQILVSFYLALMFWNHFGWGRTRRVLPMLILGYFFIEYLARKKRTRTSTITLEHQDSLNNSIVEVPVFRN